MSVTIPIYDLPIVKIVFKCCVFAFIGWFFYMLIVHPHPYNTEQVCFNDSGKIVFYASGFKPSNTPVIHIMDKKYKNIQTNETISGVCRWSWGAGKPKGYDYWKLINSNGETE